LTSNIPPLQNLNYACKTSLTEMNEPNQQPPMLKAWAAFFVTATVFGAIAGALVGGLAGALIGATQGPEAVAASGLLFQLLGFLVALPVSFFSFKWAVGKFILPAVLPQPESPQSATFLPGN
jgi:hypothetical protein